MSLSLHTPLQRAGHAQGGGAGSIAVCGDGAKANWVYPNYLLCFCLGQCNQSRYMCLFFDSDFKVELNETGDWRDTVPANRLV